MTYTIRYNRSTNHLQGIAERTQSSGGESGGVVSYYAESACGGLTRGIQNQSLMVGAEFRDISEAIRVLETDRNRKPCKNCLAAAKCTLKVETENALIGLRQAERDSKGVHTEPCPNCESGGVIVFDGRSRRGHVFTFKRNDRWHARMTVNCNHGRMGGANDVIADTQDAAIERAAQRLAPRSFRDLPVEDGPALNLDGFDNDKETEVNNVNTGEPLRRAVSVRLSEIAHAAVSPNSGEVEIVAIDKLRGPAVISMSIDNARWLRAMLNDLYSAGKLGEILD